MTLPIQPLCGDNVSLPLRRTSGRRRPCLSAAWADPPTLKERRRAIYSWSVGYGTLNEYDESPKKVADISTLLEPRGRRPIATTTNSTTGATTKLNNTSIPIPHAPTQQKRNRARELFAMPGLKTLVTRRRNSGAGITESAVPLVNKKDVTPSIRPTTSLASLKKCETVLALTNVLRSSSSSSSIEKILPVNRLRLSPTNSNSRICSRCSSLLSLASSSRYSLNTSTGGFIQVNNESLLLCKLCLVEVPSKNACNLQQCKCSFCAQVN